VLLKVHHIRYTIRFDSTPEHNYALISKLQNNITLCSIQSSLPYWNSCGVSCSGLWTSKMIILILRRCEFCRACSSVLIRTDCSDLVRQFTLSEFQSVAYAENFHEGGSFSGIWWSFVFGVLSLWRHNLTSCSCFQADVLARFADIIGTLFYKHSPYFVCHCTENKLSALQVTISTENKLNATTQQFITAKISGSTLKRGEWNTLITASELFTTANSGCPNVLLITSSRA